MPDKAFLASDDGERATARRRMPASERRVLILEAALRTFATHGYDGAAMDEIASAAGISKAVVYDHVTSKRELYEQLLDAIRLDLDAAVDRALEPVGLEGEERVRAAVTAFFRYVQDHREASRLLLHEVQGTKVSNVGRQMEERVTQQLARALGADPGLFDGHPDRMRQLRILAELLKAGVQGLASWWLRHPDVPREDLVERTVAVVWPAMERARGRADP